MPNDPSPYDLNLDKGPANYTPLSPLSFLKRSAFVYPTKTAVIHGNRRYSYEEFYDRCRRLASSLNMRGVQQGDTVAILAPNVPELLEAHYGVPMLGAVLNAINIRLDAPTVAFILEHGNAKVLIADTQFQEVITAAIATMANPPFVIDIDDVQGQGGACIGNVEYEAFIAAGDKDYAWSLPDDEWQSISLNYTSGTTGNPKGVVYDHRGAYLNAIGNAMTFGLNPKSVYLWTLPMFHCNGWNHTWMMPVLGGTVVCCRDISAKAIYDAIADKGVTHFGGAPIVLNLIVNAKAEDRRTFDHQVEVFTAGAPPAPATLASIETLGFNVTQVYGLTEILSDRSPECAVGVETWAALPQAEERATLMARQGVNYLTLEDQRIADPETMKNMPADGETVGELMLRGNTVMKGYFKDNADATDRSLSRLDGWFHTGDLGVMHSNGYIEIKDRAKDIIISGGENISSVEVEGILHRHPSIALAAVVAMRDEKWGEVPCAFVEP